MLTDDYIEQSADETSEEFNSLEILLLIWMALRLKKLADLENITEDYDSWKETATKEFSEYVGTQFSKTRKTALGLVKSVVQKGVEKTLNESKKRVEEYTEVKKDTVLTQPIKKILNKGVKDTQDEIKNLCNISRKCTNRQFIRYCDQAYSKIVAGQDAEKAIESSIRSLAKDLRISNITTKRAYEELEHDGFIEAIPGKGYFVKKKSSEFLKEEVYTKIEEKLNEAITLANTYNIEYSKLKEMLDTLYKEE